MGRISQKLVSTFRRQAPLIDDELHAHLQMFAAGLTDSAPVVDRLLQDGYDALHIKYILGHEFVMMFSDAMPEYKEFDEYFDIVADADRHYVANPDETTPVTGSFFSLWSLLDVRFGGDQETMGSCLVDVLVAMQADPHVLRLVKSLSASRMGVYQHLGDDGSYARLRELVTGQELRCHSVSGHPGQPGELWFVRLGAPLDDTHDHYVTLTTPYVLTEATVDDWTAYLNKSLLGCGAGEPQNLYELLKFGKSRTAWLDFVVRAFQQADENAVYLAGLPDVPASLPNAACIESLLASDLRPATKLVQERVSLQLTAPQRKMLMGLLPELGQLPDVKSHRPLRVSLMRLQLRRAETQAQAALDGLKGSQRKPYERLLEWAAADRSVVTGQAVYQLCIELDCANPRIWRKIQTCDCTLDELHVLIQAAMGWENAHLYEFDAGGVRYSGLPEDIDDDSPDGGDAGTTFLSQTLPISDRPVSLTYHYDFGDDWCHTVTIEKIVPVNQQMKYPVCLAGSGACPPEDCGGIYQYGYLIEALADPDSDEYDWAVEMLGESADLKAFNAKAATRIMQRCLEQ